MHNAQCTIKGKRAEEQKVKSMHNYEQKVLLIYDGASPKLCHLNVSLFPRLGGSPSLPRTGVMPQSRLRGFGKASLKLGAGTKILAIERG